MRNMNASAVPYEVDLFVIPSTGSHIVTPDKACMPMAAGGSYLPHCLSMALTCRRQRSAFFRPFTLANWAFHFNLFSCPCSQPFLGSTFSPNAIVIV
ncbi:MAG: hypothetical protein MUP53_06625, partial [Bacteroidales bacterium]|nr:hypothetical protein [Bacteroidales bacterium]